METKTDCKYKMIYLLSIEMFDKICKICSKEFKGWLSSKYCNKCGDKVRKEKRKIYNREYREKLLNSKKQDAHKI